MNTSFWRYGVLAGFLVGIAGLMAGCGLGENFGLEKVAGGLRFPLYVTSTPDDATRLFAVEQNRGRIRVIEQGRALRTPFLDIGDSVYSSGLERGLLGLAFHPEYAANGRFFVNYTAQTSEDKVESVIEEYRVSEDPLRADVASARTLLRFEQPHPIHNGGMMAFGHDGYLYIASGDGGPGNDPDNRAQSLDTLLGKILRIDVDNGTPYGIPPDNPFVDVEGARGEIWAYGLRNPWRFSFDRDTGDMYIGDVGERAREEINFEPFDSPGGRNYGWNVREGRVCRPGQDDCHLPDAVDPVHDYENRISAAVTGGYVYRGTAIPELQGEYIFGDYSTGQVWGMRHDGADVTALRRLPSLRPRRLLPTIASFGEDADGELYVVSWLSGNIYKIVPRNR